MESPYHFDATNHRVVTNVSANNKVLIGTAALYSVSMYGYMRRYLRVDGNAVAAAAFAAFSLPAAYSYSRFFLSSA